MSEPPEILRDLFRLYDEEMEPLSEVSVNGEIRDRIKSDEGSEPPYEPEVVAESLAFAFCESDISCDNDWSTYYGPKIVMQDASGQSIDFPSITEVTPEMIEYWELHAQQAKHPFLKARYADLVWDFSKHVKGKGANIAVAHTLIDATLEMATRGLCDGEPSTRKKLERALSLALGINDTGRTEAVRDSIIAYEDAHAHKNTARSRGWAFELLLLEQKRVPLSEDQEKKLVGDMEDRLQQVSDIEKPDRCDAFETELVALPLAEYFKKKDRKDDVLRVLRRFGGVAVASSRSDRPLGGLAWLEKLREVYIQYEMKADAEALYPMLHEAGKKTAENLHEISTEVSIPKEKIEAYLDEMVKGSTETTLHRIAFQFVPKKGDAIKEITTQAKKAPLSYLITKTIFDDDGRHIASVGPLEDDLDGHVIHHISQSMSFNVPFLRLVIERTQQDHDINVNALLSHLYMSPAFPDNKRSLLETGLTAYLEGDQIVAIHILIPQLEDMIRHLMQKVGRPTFRPRSRRNGGFMLKTLGDLLSDEGFLEMFGEDVVLYFRVLLTDPRGWNVRNAVCHGFAPTSGLTSYIADRIFHALLVLALLRASEDENATDAYPDGNFREDRDGKAEKES
ncbi:DUF4209 domain-containing protein [Candidatus Hydrogenedentota bacterium]